MRWAPTATAYCYWALLEEDPLLLLLFWFPHSNRASSAFQNTFWYSNLTDRMVLMMVPLDYYQIFVEKEKKNYAKNFHRFWYGYVMSVCMYY